MLSFRFLGALLWQRRVAFCAAFLIASGTLLSLLWIVPPKFAAEGLLVVDTRPLRSVMGIVTGREQANPLQPVDPSILTGEVNYLTSKAILRRLVAEAGLADDPEFVNRGGILASIMSKLTALSGLAERAGLAGSGLSLVESRNDEAVRQLAKALMVEIPRGSSQLRVTVRSVDPAKAATLANQLMAIYLEEQIKAKESVASATLRGLGERLEELAQRLVTANAAVQTFRDTNGLLKAGTTSPLVQQLADLTASEQRARIESSDAAARLRLLRSAGTDSSSAIAAASPVHQNALGDLAVQDADARSKLASAMARLGSSHPTVIELRAAAREIADRLAAQKALIADAVAGETAMLAERERRLAEAVRDVRERLRRENELEARLDQLTSEAQAAKLAYEEFLASYNRTLALEQSSVPDVRVLYTASTPDMPTLPKQALLLIGLVVSGAAAIAWVVLLHLIANARRHTARQFEERYGVPIVGMTPMLGKSVRRLDPTRHLQESPLSDYAEAVRGIRNTIDFERGPIHSVAVVSAAAGEGKSTLALSLAAAWAAAGRRTLLIDCDIRRSKLATIMNCEGALGVGDMLALDANWDAMVQRNERLGLDFIVAGGGSDRVSFQFTREAIAGLLARFKPRYDRIVLDLPPILSVSDGEVGAAVSDLTLLVSLWGSGRADATLAAVERVRMLGGEIRAVLSKVDTKKYRSLTHMDQYALSPLTMPLAARAVTHGLTAPGRMPLPRSSGNAAEA